MKNGFQKKTDTFYEAALRIEGYTPDDQDILLTRIAKGNLQFERPFAGLLYGTFDVIYIFEKSFLRTGFLLGIMGPSSQADGLQRWFHENITDGSAIDGWVFQLPDQPLINVNVYYLYDLLPVNSWFDVFGTVDARLGNLYIDSGLGLGVRLGKFNSVGNSTIFGNRLNDKNSPMEVYFGSTVKGSINGFNATAQGNLFNLGFEYALDDISRFTFASVQGIYFSWRRFSASYEHFFTYGQVIPNERHWYARSSFNYRF